MENRNTKIYTYPTNYKSFENFNDSCDDITRRRLDQLLTINLETARENSLYSSEQEKTEAGLMKNPLSTEQTFAYFGLILGSLPPAALFLRFLIDARNFRSDDAWILGVFVIVNLISAVVGYFSGKLIGKIVRETEKISWTKMLLLLPFIGIFWGFLAGGAGGVIIFIIGAVFGAILGAAVGSLALPVFTVFHRLLKKGDDIERKHFLPLAFGISLVISAFMLGL
jgi:hypothetical protein